MLPDHVNYQIYPVRTQRLSKNLQTVSTRALGLIAKWQQRQPAIS